MSSSLSVRVLREIADCNPQLCPEFASDCELHLFHWCPPAPPPPLPPASTSPIIQQLCSRSRICVTQRHQQRPHVHTPISTHTPTQVLVTDRDGETDRYRKVGPVLDIAMELCWTESGSFMVPMSFKHYRHAHVGPDKTGVPISCDTQFDDEYVLINASHTRRRGSRSKHSDNDSRPHEYMHVHDPVPVLVWRSTYGLSQEELVREVCTSATGEVQVVPVQLQLDFLSQILELVQKCVDTCKTFINTININITRTTTTTTTTTTTRTNTMAIGSELHTHQQQEQEQNHHSMAMPVTDL